MLLSKFEEKSHLGNQLTFDFSDKPSSGIVSLSQRTKVSGHVNAIISTSSHQTESKKYGRINFYPESSEITNYSFTIKLSYEGASYLVHGKYKRDYICHYDDPSSFHIKIGALSIDSIRPRRGDRYISDIFPHEANSAITKSIPEILIDSISSQPTYH